MTEPTRTLVLELARRGLGHEDIRVKLNLPEEMWPEVRRMVLETAVTPSNLAGIYWRNLRLIKVK